MKLEEITESLEINSGPLGLDRGDTVYFLRDYNGTHNIVKAKVIDYYPATGNYSIRYWNKKESAWFHTKLTDKSLFTDLEKAEAEQFLRELK